jgi:hypothetical protein
MENPQIYTRIAQIMRDVKAVTKSRRNQSQNFVFRGIDDVMNELHDVFAKNGVFILPKVKEYTVEVRATKSGTSQNYIRASITYRYTAEDGSYVETDNVGEAMDSGDKAMNKAMSVALKYSLLQMLLIPTEESKDPDEFTAEDTDFYSIVKSNLMLCNSVAELTSLWEDYPAMHQDNKFIKLFSQRKAKLQQ